MAWVMAWGLALIGLAVVFVLFPKWPVTKVLPQPAAPHVVLAGAGQTPLGKASELRLVRSPSLIALAHGTAIPRGTVKQANGVNPPMGMPPELPAGLGMAPFVRQDGPMAESKGAFWHKDFLSVGVSAGMLKSPVFRKEQALGTRGVRVEYGDGLKAKSLEVADWSWDPWIQPGVPWTISLDIQSDDQGCIVQVLLDEPSADPAFNEALIRTLYQRGRVRPAGPGQGRIVVSFSGVP
ncbi:MAG: hypothetical protein KKE37_11995 [Verrucomicrobia bacterium]|nr:hypothetical protein [Verrucomicrobiota bacterium]MBU4290459.1 hypothetical protein [Verrucomicrobiota bacterium]MBU4430057.1 hypothetical protein [Verrucomicrobiota bacterium]MCG2681116.1 hypothetical protein [Kiritimatiellia bacterium]